MALPDLIIVVLGYLGLIGISAFAILQFVFSRIKSRAKRKRKESLESTLEMIEQAVEEKIRRDFGVIPEGLPVKVMPGITKTDIISLPLDETIPQKLGRRIRRTKIKREMVIALHVQDYEVDFGQPSPETEEDIVKWAIIANTQRKIRPYMPPDISDAIVKGKTEEYSFELANEGKVSSESIGVAESEEVDIRTYRKVSTLDSEEIGRLYSSARNASKSGMTRVHESRQAVRHELDTLFADAVGRKIKETHEKLKKARQKTQGRKLELAKELLDQAESAMDDPETALDYDERAEGTLKTALEDTRQLILGRVEDFPQRKKRELIAVDWSGATLGKSANIGRYSKPELDRIRSELGVLSAAEISALRYRFGVILVYIYSFPGSTPNEIAEGTALLPTTVAAEVHFLEKLGYVRSLTRSRLARKCYPRLEIKTIATNVEKFEGKQILVMAKNASVSRVNGSVIFEFTQDGSEMRIVAPEWIDKSVQEKILRQKFCVCAVRRLGGAEPQMLDGQFIAEIDDPSALSIQEATGFETGKQGVLEDFILKSEDKTGQQSV